jgi:hypothetical protein
MTSISRRQLVKVMGPVALLAGMDGSAARRFPEREPRWNDRAPVWNPNELAAPFMKDPVWVYDNWSAYVEGVPDHPSVKLTEALSMEQLQQLLRFKRLGVSFDYYMMNAFWYAPDGGYRLWRKPDWPNGPDRWIEACWQAGIKPGLWFGTNALWQLNATAKWKDSLSAKKSALGLASLSMTRGGFLEDYMQVLQYWYDRGIRMFEFDVVDFDAATPEQASSASPREIRAGNEQAFANALKTFRHKNQDVVLVAFNGFGGNYESTDGPWPFKDPVDLRWLEVFDTLYSGDTRVSEVPLTSFWRSVDLYNDHMARRYEQSGVPLERIDPFFTLSTTWFGYNRGKRAWKGMLLLLIARGGWKKSVYGRLDLLSDEDVQWFSRVRAMFDPLLAMGRTKTFGGIPGEARPYGFGSFDITGSLYTVVNPAQEVCSLKLPQLSAVQSPLRNGRVIFRDAGFVPYLERDHVVLGPGQMAVIGFGRFDAAECDLGVQEDVIIPKRITPLPTQFVASGANAVQARIALPERGDIRALFQQRDAHGAALKGYGIRGQIEAWQNQSPVAVHVDAESETHLGGLSWSGGEIKRAQLNSKQPLTIRYSLDTKRAPTAVTAGSFQGRLFVVEY